MVRLHSVVTAWLGGLLMVTAEVPACSGFLATGDDGVLFGNNEDFWNPATVVRQTRTAPGAVSATTASSEPSDLVLISPCLKERLLISSP